MIRAVLSQDLEDAQKAEKPNQAGGSRRHSNFTPRQLVRDICSEEHGLVGGILDIPLHVLSASSTALTTGLLLWNKNKVLLMALLGMSAVTYNLKTFVARTRDWLGARLGVHVEDKYDLSAAELDLLDGVDNFKDMRVNGNELYHLEQYQISKVCATPLMICTVSVICCPSGQSIVVVETTFCIGAHAACTRPRGHACELVRSSRKYCQAISHVVLLLAWGLACSQQCSGSWRSCQFPGNDETTHSRFQRKVRRNSVRLSDRGAFHVFDVVV